MRCKGGVVEYEDSFMFYVFFELRGKHELQCVLKLYFFIGLMCPSLTPQLMVVSGRMTFVAFYFFHKSWKIHMEFMSDFVKYMVFFT